MFCRPWARGSLRLRLRLRAVRELCLQLRLHWVFEGRYRKWALGANRWVPRILGSARLGAAVHASTMLHFMPPGASLLLRIFLQTRHIRKIIRVAAAFVVVRIRAQTAARDW
jgi:hypothetical protein